MLPDTMNRYKPYLNYLTKVCSTCAATALLIVSFSAYSLPNDSEQPITLQSDRAEFNRNAGTTTYSGSVVMEQGSMKIQADEVVIYGKVKSVSRIVAKGTPAQFTQVPKAGSKPVTATGETLEYKVSDKILYLVEDAKLEQEGSTLTGPKIVYDVKKAVVHAGDTKKESNDRIRMVIPPTKK